MPPAGPEERMGKRELPDASARPLVHRVRGLQRGSAMLLLCLVAGRDLIASPSGGCYERREQGVRCQRPTLELRVELASHEVRMVTQLYHLH